MKTRKPISVRKYVQHGGVICPVCLDTTVDGGDHELNDGVATQNCMCTSCGAEWTDIYKLSSYSDLVIPAQVKATS